MLTLDTSARMEPLGSKRRITPASLPRRVRTTSDWLHRGFISAPETAP